MGRLAPHFRTQMSNGVYFGQLKVVFGHMQICSGSLGRCRGIPLSRTGHGRSTESFTLGQTHRTAVPTGAAGSKGAVLFGMGFTFHLWQAIVISEAIYLWDGKNCGFTTEKIMEKPEKINGLSLDDHFPHRRWHLHIYLNKGNSLVEFGQTHLPWM